MAGLRLDVAVAVAALCCGLATRSAAQQPVSDVLSFLLTNRSIPTADFARDGAAAEATRDSISNFLLIELAHPRSARQQEHLLTGSTLRLARWSGRATASVRSSQSDR